MTTNEELIEIAQRSSGECGYDLELDRAIFDMCASGNTARLEAIRSAHRIENIMVRMSLVADLITGHDGTFGCLHREALDLLADSNHTEDWQCLSELVHIFDDRVSRPLLCSALRRAQAKATGTLKDNLRYDLSRRGG
jgi:hypothetical protein